MLLFSLSYLVCNQNCKETIKTEEKKIAAT